MDEKIKQKPKVSSTYEVGDYIVGKSKVYLRIVAVVDSEMGKMYGYTSPKMSGAELDWNTQYELDQEGFSKGQPDIEKYKTVKAGDIFRTGQKDDDVFVTVLARVGDAVLMSKIPKKGLAAQLLKMDQFLKEMAADTGAETPSLLDDEEMKRLKRLGSQLHSSKTAGDWMSVEDLCLMHWDWIEE